MLTIAILSANVVLLSGLAVIAWGNRNGPSARIFAVLQAISAIWASLTIFGLRLPPGSLRIRIWSASIGISLLVVSLWLGFILSYTGRDRWLTPQRYGITIAPLVAGSTLYFIAPSWTPLVGELDQATISAGTVVQATIGPVGAIVAAYIYIVFLIGFILVTKTILESDTLFVGQAIAFVLGTLITVVASAMTVVGFPGNGYPLTQVALWGQSLLWGYAVFRQQFLQLVPAVGRIGERAVFRRIDDGLLVIDSNGTVIRANPQAHSYLNTDELVGESVETVLEWMGVTSLTDLTSRFEHQGRTYQAKASAVTNWRDESIGQALVIRDVTQLVRRQQRLQVLNRIVRHNLRNDMNVVRGRADQIQQRDDEELTAIGEAIARKADGLTTISEKALKIEKILDRSMVAERVDPPALVEKVVSPLIEKYPAATVSTTVDIDEFQTVPRLLSLVLEEVVENALMHSGDTPQVSVTLSRTNESVQINVTDDGPGIPDMEIDPIRSGEETDLQHASSLGLWLVYWGVQSLGGNVEITTTEAGSTVVLTVPDLQESDTTALSPQIMVDSDEVRS